MSEVITACENVCRDFAWLGDWVPTILASVTAIVIAFVAYPWQKRVDRQEAVRARHFSVYVEIVEAVCEIGNSANRGGVGKEESLSRYFTARAKFSIVASDGAMQKFLAFDRKITSGAKVPPEEFDRLLGEFLIAVRKENLGNTNIPSIDLISLTPYGKSVRN